MKKSVILGSIQNSSFMNLLRNRSTSIDSKIDPYLKEELIDQ